MKKVLLAVVALVLSFGAKAQIESHVKWSYAAKRLSPTEAVVFLKATIDEGWHVYGLNVPDGGPIKTSFTFAKSNDYSLVGAASQPTPIKKYESTFKMDVTYFEKSVIFQQKIKLKSAGATTVKGQLEYMTCNDHKCLPPEDIDFTIPVSK